MHDGVHGIGENVGEITPEEDEDRGGGAESESAEGSDEHHDFVVFIREPEHVLDGDAILFLFFGWLLIILILILIFGG